MIAHGFISPLLKRMGETEIIDELRVIISEEERTTAYFTFSSQMRPSLHQFRVLWAEERAHSGSGSGDLIKLRGGRFKSYAEKFIPPVIFASQLSREPDYEYASLRDK